MATVNISAMAKTWNDAGTTFTAIKMDVTDTASNAASLLLDLKVGGSSKFNVSKTGDITVPQSGAFDEPRFKMQGFDTGVALDSNTRVSMISNGTGVAMFKAGTGMLLRNVEPVSWGNALINGGSDVSLFRDGAGILAHRVGTAAQEHRIYNTFTDASNYERLAIRWNSNVLEMFSEAAGTGTARQMKWGVGNRSFDTGAVAGANAILFNSSYIQVGNIAGDASRIFWLNNTDGMRFSTGLGIAWSGSATNAASTLDTGIERNAAGVVKITDGSTGIGELIFKVPTSDPGITGALWNNAGTLAISA